MHFYPRSPCGERQPATRRHDKDNIFLSTLSLRRATSRILFRLLIKNHFYPRSPCGERLSSSSAETAKTSFLSTLSLRRATVENACADLNIFISIHALLAESDIHRGQRTEFSEHFYPRSPCGERLIFRKKDTPSRNISIHALLAESD